MDATEKFYQKRINAIAKRSSDLRIKRHIIHHAKELTNPKVTKHKLSRVSSMYNLLKIYEAVHGIKSTIPIQTYKLLKKNKRTPRTSTPPPGGKIPK